MFNGKAYFYTITDGPCHLLPVLAAGRVQALYDAGGVAEDHGVAGGARHHAEHRQPQVRHVLRGEPPVSDAQHVRHGLEQRPGVLLPPPGFLHNIRGVNWDLVDSKQSEPHRISSFKIILAILSVQYKNGKVF